MELMTVGTLIAALQKLDPALSVGLRFLPAEGGHRGPNESDVPFTVDPVEDGEGNAVCVVLTEA